MMHLQSYSMRFNTLPKSSAMEFWCFPLLVPVYGIWLSTVNSPCSIVQKHNCVIPLYSYNDMFKSYIYIYVMVHSTCKCYLLFCTFDMYWKMYYYLFTISSCAMCLWCVTYHTLTILCNQSQRALASPLFPSNIFHFTFCLLLHGAHSFFKIIFFGDSPVQLTSVLLCHHNILPVSKYFTYFYLNKKYFIIDL